MKLRDQKAMAGKSLTQNCTVTGKSLGSHSHSNRFFDLPIPRLHGAFIPEAAWCGVIAVFCCIILDSF